MKFYGKTEYNHRHSPKKGVLICNLGTPDAPTPKALRRYLKEFLSDQRVVEIPRLIWWFILNAIILRIRPRRSAKLYRHIWLQQGSPLLTNSLAQRDKIRHSLQQQDGTTIPVELGMRYGNPSIDSALQLLYQQNVDDITVLPLYPQYCAATTASTFDAIAKNFNRQRWLPSMRFINGYHRHPLYIEALAQSIFDHLENNHLADKIVCSYHGIPQRNLKLGDPYYCFCMQTTRLLKEALVKKYPQIESRITTTFQSRFGKAQWLQPYTDKTLAKFPEQGVKSVILICPGFAADCLETIDEVGHELSELFYNAGGEQFALIPCLNDNSHHIKALTQILTENSVG